MVKVYGQVNVENIKLVAMTIAREILNKEGVVNGN